MQLLGHFFRREFRSRYLGSMSGLLWAVIHPALQLMMYAVVFEKIFKSRIIGAEAHGLVAYLPVGFWAWTLFAESSSRAVTTVVDNAALIRPFDVRTTVYDRNIAVHRRERVSAHFLPPRRNLGLITNRAVEAGACQHVLCTTQIIAHHALSIKEINYLLPLWLYEGGDRPNHRRSNLNPDFVLGLPGKPKPEQVFNYVYAILHSPGYRQRYRELLKTDFPPGARD